MTSRGPAVVAVVAVAFVVAAAVLFLRGSPEPSASVERVAATDEAAEPPDLVATGQDETGDGKRPVAVDTAQNEDGPEEAAENAPRGAAELREALVSFGGCLAERQPGFVRLTALTDDISKMVTPANYSPPFRVKIRARTDSTNIRLQYSLGWVILNWEVDRHKLMVGDLLRPVELAYPGRGYVSTNEWHDIVWEITEDRTLLLVDGEERFSREEDYASIVSCVGIGPAWGSTVDVASFVVEALPKSPRREKQDAPGVAEKEAGKVGEGKGPQRKARTLYLGWSSAEQNATYCVVWADYDKDGDPDLTVGNKWAPGNNQIYRNDGGKLALVWTAPYQEKTESDGLAWADIDGDGDLDLAVGDEGNGFHIYVNDGGTMKRSWSSVEKGSVMAVDWADLDGDGDPDLAVACTEASANRLYRNDDGTLVPAWTSYERDRTEGQAWGDLDGDGDPDLAVANYAEQPNRIYRNDRGRMVLAWTSTEACNSLGVDWGDFDGDGDLDLAVANEGQPNCVYRNDGGRLVVAWWSRDRDLTRSVAWGDWDGDGDLDLAAGNEGNPNRVYENKGGRLSLAWSSDEWDKTVSVAWGDLDGDGRLDLAVGNKGPNRVYLNVEQKTDEAEMF